MWPFDTHALTMPNFAIAVRLLHAQMPNPAWVMPDFMCITLILWNMGCLQVLSDYPQGKNFAMPARIGVWLRGQTFFLMKALRHQFGVHTPPALS